MENGDKVIFTHNLTKWREEINLLVDAASNLQKSPTISSLHSNGSSDVKSTEVSYNSTDSDDSSKVTVQAVLKEHPTGRRVMEHYRKTNNMIEEHRNLIINIIATFFETNSYHMSLQISYKLENEILVMFPSEKIEFYRTGRRGRIYTKFCNMKKTLKCFPDRDNDNDGTTTFKSPKIQFSKFKYKYICTLHIFYK